ncbi:MAG: phosphate ABC transporter permease subunit PstC [Spirochaetia bacterium]
MNRGRFKDHIFLAAGRLITLTIGLLVFAIVGGLLAKSLPLVKSHSLGTLLVSSSWRPSKGEFGFLPYILGTIWVTGFAMVIVVPIGLLAAVYLSEYAVARVKKVITSAIDIIAGVPSVVFGACGIVVVVPFIRDVLAPALGLVSTGYSVLAGSIVLSVMVLPIMINGSYEILRTVPQDLREASLSLGTTRWEAIKFVVLRKAAPGIMTAIVLAFARALGETMAVLMVVGNVALIPHGLLQPASPLPALIANNYGEMLSIPLYDSALMFAALVLLGAVVVFDVIGGIAMHRVKRSMD